MWRHSVSVCVIIICVTYIFIPQESPVHLFCIRALCHEGLSWNLHNSWSPSEWSYNVCKWTESIQWGGPLPITAEPFLTVRHVLDFNSLLKCDSVPMCNLNNSKSKSNIRFSGFFYSILNIICTKLVFFLNNPHFIMWYSMSTIVFYVKNAQLQHNVQLGTKRTNTNQYK